MQNLWSANHPGFFWLCQPDPPPQAWRSAIAGALPLLGLSLPDADIDAVLAQTLGEARFGPDHWQLSFPKRVYYLIKPLLPRLLTKLMRRFYSPAGRAGDEPCWPVEPRYAAFLWDVLARVVQHSEGQTLQIRSLWPDGRRFALVLTHDVEGQAGLDYVRCVADLEESLGFRSSFNFVPEGYPLDTRLMEELRGRGFEVGIHGLKHDGWLFSSRPAFEKKAARINAYLKSTQASGFRAPLTIRNPEWMQCLELEYDSSFFDTDPFEPISGGVMTIWPYYLGRFVELPYTLVQDYTLTDVLKEDSPRLWMEKVQFIREHCGMALLNTHPDYLQKPPSLEIYARFLTAMRDEKECWKALPAQVARWWNERPKSGCLSKVWLDGTDLCISPMEHAGAGSAYHVALADRRSRLSPIREPAGASPSAGNALPAGGYASGGSRSDD